MLYNEILKKVKKIVAEATGGDPAELIGRTTFEKLSVNPQEKSEIVESLENKFHVEIPEKEARAISTVGEAAKCVKKAVEAKNPKRKRKFKP